VLPIWEGTTNVLALDALRAALKEGDVLASLKEEVELCARSAGDARLAHASQVAREAAAHAGAWLAKASSEGRAALESGARRFALTLGRALSLALLTRHAQWSLGEERDGRALAACRRFALSGIDLVVETDAEDAFALMNDR